LHGAAGYDANVNPSLLKSTKSQMTVRHAPRGGPACRRSTVTI
jgi:hypothetical protein